MFGNIMITGYQVCDERLRIEVRKEDILIVYLKA